MKILFFYQYFGTPKGSWSTRVYELCRRWVAAGHEVTVVTSPYYKSDISTDQFIAKQKIDGIQLIIINAADSNKVSLMKRIVNAITFSIVSIYFALTYKIDIVIASSGPITIGLPGLMAKWFRKKVFVFEVRDLWPLGAIELKKIKSPILIKLGLWFERLCYRNASLIVPCSPGMEKGVQNVYKKAKTLVIPNASDTNLFDTRKKELPENFPEILREKKIFLYAGSLGLMDECEQMISGMEYVNDDEIALVLAGGGAEKEKLEQLAKSKKNNNIYFLGLLPKTEIVKWFSIATASFVTFKDLQVLHTSSPNKMFDSFAAGVPIIQSTKGWIKELVEIENCGINVAPDQPQQFADAMRILKNNKDLRDKMSNNAKNLALTKFSRDLLAEKYLKELENVF